jgi:signal transduction histidine kinase
VTGGSGKREEGSSSGGVPVRLHATTPDPASSSGRNSTLGDLRFSAIMRFRPTAEAEVVRGRPRRRGLRSRLLVFLVVASVVPVSVVSFVATMLVFSSIEQGVSFEASRGLQVARGLFLQQIQEAAARASKLGSDAALVAAVKTGGLGIRRRLAELSASEPRSLLEVVDALGHPLARCVAGRCGDEETRDAFPGLAPASASAVLPRALLHERTVTIERTNQRLAIRSGLPLTDPTLSLLGAMLVSSPADGLVADRIKAALGAAREVMFYDGDQPSISTLTGAKGERVAVPALPFKPVGAEGKASIPVVPLEMGGRPYTVAFGPLQDADGRHVGFLAVAVDRESLAAARRRALLTLVLGSVGALGLALALADILARRLTRPLQDLHAGAMGIARGDLETSISVNSPDELGDVAEAFRVMVQSLKENQEGLAARVRELVTVHQVGRALSSVVDLDLVLRSIVGEALSVLGAKTAAIALSNEPIANPKKFVIRAVAGEPVGRRLAEMAGIVAARGRARRTDAVEVDPDLALVAAGAGLRGPLLAAPLALKDRLLGVLLVGRLADTPFNDADLRLLVTLADQTATAVENARLYSEVRAFSENLEIKVRERTAELERAKAETEHALKELGAAQTQLIHTERMAGLGLLVAGIAHEVNSPAAAVQGSVDALETTIGQLGTWSARLSEGGVSPDALSRFFRLVDQKLPRLVVAPLTTAVETRQISRRLRTALTALPAQEQTAAVFADLGVEAEPIVKDLLGIFRPQERQLSLEPFAGYLRELVFLGRAVATIRTSISTIRRIVGALKRYSRLDEAPLERVDVHAGLEDTLVILGHQLKSHQGKINVRRAYGTIPPIAAYVGELNQVWTNLIHNALQAVAGAGDGTGEIVLETSLVEGNVIVAVEDSGPGIPGDLLARVFEPFFTTKEKGEGTGLGLSIAHRIVEKHGGTIRVQSRPGRTRFEVALPVEGPAPTSLVSTRSSGKLLELAGISDNDERAARQALEEKLR